MVIMSAAEADFYTVLKTQMLSELPAAVEVFSSLSGKEFCAVGGTGDQPKES